MQGWWKVEDGGVARAPRLHLFHHPCNANYLVQLINQVPICLENPKLGRTIQFFVFAFEVPNLGLNQKYKALFTFRAKNNPMQKKAAPAITVAFLTLMTLKLENKEICVKLTPNDQVDMKKLSKLEFSGVWPLIWPFRPSSAFYNFFEMLGT